MMMMIYLYSEKSCTFASSEIVDEGPDVTAAKAPDCFKASSGFAGGGNEDIADTSFSFICKKKEKLKEQLKEIQLDKTEHVG